MKLRLILTSDQIERFIAERAKVANISSKSFLVTVLGDVMSMHGDWVWLGSLIEALEGLGYSERLVRTSVFRLVQDDWLTTKKVGRRSYYSLTDNAKRHNQKAARRIYAKGFPNWDGRWLLVVPAFVNEPQLSQFRRQLEWLGFSVLSGGVYAHPSFDQQSLEETVNELNLTDSVVIFSSKTLDSASATVLKKLVHEQWNIQQLEQQYQDFLTQYQPMLAQLNGKEPLVLSIKQCFLLRTLVVHEYRRILLKDHELPEDMLPASWAGYEVHDLVGQLYARLAKPSLSYICTQLHNSDGLLPIEDADFWRRFNHES
jgi:phenylacetic acid degradation operon negative regulatory protein